jgi:hypothetical protein
MIAATTTMPAAQHLAAILAVVMTNAAIPAIWLQLSLLVLLLW